MTSDPHRLEGMDSQAKRDLLAQLLRERAAGSGSEFDLSLGQEGLWFLYQVTPEAVPYNVALCGRIRGEVDRDRLEWALLKLLERHPMLRCTFALTAQGPRQRIGAVPERCLEFVDASGWTESELRARVQDAYAPPFDLARGPIFRASLFSRDTADHVLLLCVHHIVADASSIGIVARELSTLYETRSTADLPSPASYAVFVKWQREMVDSKEGQEAWKYWHARLANFLSPIDLPTDHPRPKTRSFRGATHHFVLTAPLCARIRELSRELNATPFMVLAAGLHTLMYRYTGSAQVAMGTPLAGRGRSGFENTVGYFVNPVVLCANVLPDSTFRRQVQHMRDAVFGAHEHGEFPFPELVKRLQPVRDNSRTPLFQVMLNLIKLTHVGMTVDLEHPGGDTLLRLGLLPVEDYPVHQQEGQFDLSLGVFDTGGAMPATLKYSTDLFEANTIERMAGHFVTLLSAAVAEPDRVVSDLPLMTAEEEHKVVVEWNRTDRDYPIETTLHALIEAQVERTPNTIAVASEAEEITYRELDSRANQIAHRLIKLGVRPGDLVGVYLDRSTAMVAGLLGTLKANAAYVPIDSSYPHDRVAYMLQDAAPSVLLTERRLAAELPAEGPPVVVLDADSSLIAESATRPEATATPDSLAYVIYTSGSTGKPKGAMLHHRAVVNHMLWMQRTWPLTASDSVLQKTPTSFDPSGWEIWAPLLAGARLVLAQPGTQGDPRYLVQTVIEKQITHLRLVPSVLELVVKEPDFAQCKSLRRLFSGGEALSRALVEQVWNKLDVEMANLYGPTEVCIVSVAWSPERGDGRFATKVPIGRPITNLRAYVLDSRMRPTPTGVPGELYLGGVGVGQGYLRRPGLTAERFVPDPFVPGGRLYKSGDVCRFRADGVLEYLGRNDFQVKVRGCRVELGEIEAALCQHGSVAQAVAMPREDVPGDARLVAYVVPRPHSSPQSAELRAYLRERLPEYMVPSAFVVLDAVPLNPSGKVDRKALPAPERDRAQERATYVAPRTPTEAKLAGIFAEVLKLERVGIHDDFFELGGHSLLAAQLLSRIRAALGADLPVYQMFETGTVAELAEAVDAKLATASTAGGKQHGVIPRISRARRRIPAEEVGGPDTAGEFFSFPLSSSQHRLWFLEQLQPGLVALNITGAERLQGPLNVPCLEMALNDLVARHEGLRTTFRTRGDSVEQIVAGRLRLPLPVVDLSALHPGEREREALRLGSEEAERPFDLVRGPLLRNILYRLGPDRHILISSMHHIVADGWSGGVLMRELETLYEDRCLGRDPSLPALPIQYPDYAEWQKDLLQGESLAQLLTYWRDRLRGAPALLELPTDHPRPAVQSHRGALYRFDMPARVAHALATLAQKEGVTVYMVLLAAYTVMLSRYSGQDDIVVASPTARRDRWELESVIGLFVNMLVFRIDLSGAPTFRELLKRVRETCLGAYAHQELPFEKLVEEIKPERDLSRHPLFQVTLNLQKGLWQPLALKNLTVTHRELQRTAAQFDLSLHLNETDLGMAGVFEYSTDLFEPDTIERMAGHFVTLLSAVIAEPDRHVAELPLLTPEERTRILVDWNATESPYPSTTIHGLIEEQVRRTPERTALVFEGHAMSYGDLNRHANQLARHLRDCGVGPDTLVGICVERSLGMVVALLGILKAGGAYLPIDPYFPAERQSYMLNDSHAPVLVTQADLSERLGVIGAQRVLMDRDWEEIARQPSDDLGPDASGRLAYVIYTSGSTGKPKGVQIEHRSVVNFLASMQREPGMTSADRLVSVTTLSFDIAGLELYLPLTIGARVILTSRDVAMDGARLGQVLREVQATVMQATPATWRVLLDSGWQQGAGLKALCGGEALPAKLAEELLATGVELWNMYGPTETTIWSTIHKVAQRENPVLIGRPIANTTIYILDQNQQPLPVKVPGELYIGGDGVAGGYLGRPELTAERFLLDPFAGKPGRRVYRTGDLVRYLADGTIEYLGRKDNQVKLRGFRIELGEVEAVLAQYPKVAQAAAIIREDVPGDQRLVGYVIANDAKPLKTGELRAFVATKLPDYMVPSALVVLPALPLSPSGKVDRKELPRPERHDGEESLGYRAPRTPVEETVAEIFREVLNLQQVSIDDDFFNLGGHSMMATRLLTRVRMTLGVDLPVRQLFETRTVAGLAQVVEAHRWRTEVAKAAVVGGDEREEFEI